MKDTTVNIIQNLIQNYPCLQECSDSIYQSIELIKTCFKNDGKILVCGNGGSASDSLHIVGELMKSFVKKRRLTKEMKDKINNPYISDHLEGALPAISLVCESALMTAYSNDKNPDLVFAQQVYGYGNEGDVLWCISTSGNSKNCIYAAEVAKAKSMKVLSLTGKRESELKLKSDCTIQAPKVETYQIQELHLPIYHTICLALENEFYEE